MDLIKLIEGQNTKNEIPDFGPGDTIKVHIKVVEGGRERVQAFTGVVIRIKGGGTRKTFTVRRVSFGIGIERVFPLHSPKIQKIEVLRRGKVRRAKLYYLREKVGKAARVPAKKIVR